MKRSVIALLSLVATAGFASVAGAQSKIGVVNTERLVQESPQYRAASEVIRTEFAPREKEIQTMAAELQARQDKLKKDAPTMTEMQRTSEERALRDRVRVLQQKQEETEEDFNTRRTQELERVQRAVLEEVQLFGKAQNYDLILSTGVLYAGAAMDVTAPILQALQNRAKAAVPAAAPAAAPAARPATPPATPAAPARQP